MRPAFVRHVDRCLGIVLCALLTGFRRLGDLLGTAAPAPPRKILLLKLIEQGATVLAVGAVRRASARVGRPNVYVCTFTENRPIWDVLELVPPENVLVVRGDRFASFVIDVVRLLVRTRRLGIDCVVDLEFYSRASAILAFLSGARVRVGLHRFTAEAPYRGDLMTIRVAHNPYLHVSEAYNQLVDVIGDPSVSEVPSGKLEPSRLAWEPLRFAATPDERAVVRAAIEALRGAPLAGPLVLLNPNAGDLVPLRRWPEERFVVMGRRLLAAHPDLSIAVTGAPAERDAAERIAAAIGPPPRVISLAGRTTLRELIVVYELADVLVTNDSGPGHFASLTDIANVVLFGPETPLVFGPRGGRPRTLWARLACSPCVNVLNHRFSPCTNNRCMQALSVDQVADVVEAALPPGARSAAPRESG